MQCETPHGGFKDMKGMAGLAITLDDAAINSTLTYYTKNKDLLTPYLARWCSALRREALRRKNLERR